MFRYFTVTKSKLPSARKASHSPWSRSLLHFAFITIYLFFFFLAWGKQVVRINLVCRCPFYLFIKASNIYGAKVMWKHQSNLWQGCWHDCLCFQSAYSLSVEIQYVNNNILILYTILKMQVSTREVQKTFSFWTGFSF